MGTPADLSILGVLNGLGRGKTGLSRDHNCFLTSLSSAGSSSPLLQTGSSRTFPTLKPCVMIAWLGAGMLLLLIVITAAALPPLGSKASN